MNTKSITSLMLIFTIIFSAVTTAFAAEGESGNMEKAILSFKKIVEIPEDYEDFNYSSNQHTYGNYKTNLWNFNWEYEKGKINASVDENGNLYTYSKYFYNSEEKGLSQVEKKDAEKSAADFLKKAVPEYYSEMKPVKNENENLLGNSYSFQYKRYVNNIPVEFSIINIEVNKFNGEVTSFFKNYFDNRKFDYSIKKAALSYEDAKKAYIEKLGIDLKYYSYYEYSNKKLNVFPAYSLKQNSNFAIDANSGDIINIYTQPELRALSSNDSAAGESKEEVQLSKEELAGVKNVSSLITKENAEGIIRKYAKIIPSDSKVTNSSLNKAYNNENKYIWTIEFEGGNGSVDANTGELISFYSYNDNNKGNKSITKEESKDIVEKFLNEVSKNKLSKTKLYIPKFESKYEKDNSNIYSFDFIRQVNGINFEQNGLRVIIDKTSGDIISYNNTWYDNANFPSIGNIIAENDIFDKISDNQDFGMKYMLDENYNLVLVYNFDSNKSNYYYEPFRGALIDYKGKEYKNDKNTSQYSDIQGHWSETIVNKLLENGYYIKGETFNPDNDITQISFLKYLYSPMNYQEDDEFYDRLVEDNIIKRQDVKPQSLVTNMEAAKFIVRYLGYDKVAQKSIIYSDMLFKDGVSHENLGYANICYGLGIIQLDKNDNFNENKNITNAEAAQIIYNLLNNK